MIQTIEYIKKISEEFFNTKLILDDFNKAVIKKLILYFEDSKEFEEKDYSLKKGILLAGGLGVGKTLIMKLFSKLCFMNKNTKSYNIGNCETIVNEFLSEGISVVDKYTLNTRLNDYNVRISKPLNFCFDDLGVENSNIKYFGNEENVMAKILYNRYELYVYNQIKTHITTNLNGEMIKEKYGDRIFSRISEMFNVIILDGYDRRQKI
jgi:DNA replication protein DnaC